MGISAKLEKIQNKPGSSLKYHKFSYETPNGDPIWHYHPEVELVYVDKGSGKCHVGNHISYYSKGSLILIGSNLPHYGFTNRFSRENKEIVIQFMHDFLGRQYLMAPEMSQIKALLEKSKFGMSFYGKTKDKVGAMMDEMLFMNDFDRMIHLLKALNTLALATEYDLLNGNEVVLETDPKSNQRMSDIYDYVRENFHRQISLEEISKVALMTVPAFCRYFKKQTKKTFTQFVNEFRIIHACKLLSETPNTISSISHDCGFNNFSHFNNLFKTYTGMNPTAYRQEFKKLIF